MPDPQPTQDAAPHPRILAALASTPWLIEPAALEQIGLIAERLNASPEAVASQLGRPLINTQRMTLHGTTALLPVRGPILRYANLFTEVSGATSLDLLATDFRAALDNPAVEQIVLHLDTPGGQSTGIVEFADQIQASTKIKPVLAYVGDLAASAGYWLASHASEVILSPTAMVGSIGVVMQYKPPKDGQPASIVSAVSPLKMATPDTDTGRPEAQRIVDQLAGIFVARVAAARRVPIETVLTDFGRGSLLVGQAAIAAGMADRIGTLDSLLHPPRSSSFSSGGFMAQQPAEAPTVIDRAYLATHHPELVDALLAEGRMAGLQAGAETERQRIQAVLACSLPGHDTLIQSLAFDGKTTAAEASFQVLQAERALRSQAQTDLSGGPSPVPAAERPLAPAAGTDHWAPVLHKFNARRAS